MNPLLHRYLRHHDGASAGGVRLIERSCTSNRGTEFEVGLNEMAAAIHQDQADLRGMLVRLGVRPSRTRRTIAWFAASAGAMKLNGRLLTYSPLSRVVELETLSSAVSEKLGLWRALADEVVREPRLDEADLTRLQGRACVQLEALARLHREATATAFVEEPSTADLRFTGGLSG
jgi:hypothetical protein